MRFWRARFARVLILALAVGSLAVSPALGLESDDDADEGFAWSEVPEVAVDLLVLRPLGTAASAIGLVFFAASAPFTAPSGGIYTSWDVFVMAPVDYTFLRPLGEL